MTRYIKSAACVLVAAFLSACATLAPEQVAKECAATDWQRYGVNDGKLGLPANARSDRFSDCQTVGQPADLVAYQAGRSEGLLDYCTAERGYQIGYSGRRYQSVCPPTLEPDFLQGYERGREDRPAVVVYPSLPRPRRVSPTSRRLSKLRDRTRFLWRLWRGLHRHRLVRMGPVLGILVQRLPLQAQAAPVQASSAQAQVLPPAQGTRWRVQSLMREMLPIAPVLAPQLPVASALTRCRASGLNLIPLPALRPTHSRPGTSRPPAPPCSPFPPMLPPAGRRDR